MTQACHYAVVAKKEGSANEMRFFHSFGVLNTSPSEALDKVRKRYILEAEFRQKWKGWVFGVMLIDHLIQIDDNGAMLLYKNEAEPVTR